MAEDAITDEELELERQRELEEQEANSDVDTSIPTGEEPEGTEEQGQDEESSAEEDSTQEPEEQPQQAPDGTDEDKETRQTRKERRAERAKKFSELRNESRQRDQQRQKLMNRERYNPMDYSKTEDELTIEQLQQDRQQYAESEFSRGAEVERFYAEQERFNDKLEQDNDYILSKPEYSFLDETSESFDADLAEGINDLYLSMAGYDDQSKTFANTGIRYKHFVPMMKQMMDKYAATRNANSERNISKQRSSAGVRPNAGTSRGSKIQWTPEKIARLSPSQLQKYGADIDRYINSQL